MLFEPQNAPKRDSSRRKGLGLSAALHALLFLFLAFNPDFLTTTPRRVVRVEGEDFQTDRFEVVELYAPPDLAAAPPVVDALPELTVPEPEAEAVPPPPPPEPPAPEEIAPEPEPELPPIPPPPVIGPDDVIADGASPDAPIAPPESEPAVAPEPPTPEPGGNGGDGAGGNGGAAEAVAEVEESPVDPGVEFPENTNANALALPNLRRQAASLIDETVAQNPRSGSGAGGDTLPNLTTDNPEILSDTRGYDFGPYMNQVIGRVRTNWYSLIPEAARIGSLRGRVVIVFTITRSGRIENLRAVGPSGSGPLDRAAVAAIQASNPFPELPPDFSGDRLVLQFAFLYNMEPGG